MSGQHIRSPRGTLRKPFTEAGSLFLKQLHYIDQLLPMLLDLVFFRVLHIFNILQDAMDVAPPRLDADSVGPADFEMTDSSSIGLANVKQPVENVVVILGVCDDFVCAVKDGGGFGIYETADVEERCVCWFRSSCVAAVNETSLKRISVPIARSTLGVIVFGFS